jgi:hypothetical protein
MMKGYVGLCLGETVVDDEIYLPHSGKVPFTTWKGDRESYILVRECYIYGIVHDESLS